MKKALIILVLAAGGYYYYNKSKSTTTDDTTTAVPATTTGGNAPITFTEADIPMLLQQYDKRIVYDSKGYWFVVMNGLIYMPGELAYMQQYQAKFPQYAEPVALPFSVWEVAAGYPEFHGGNGGYIPA